ncbi:two-component system, OmpR family, sensor kinase [Amycolatopsis xylanica]|uniref:histidine kinase n=1 Tax=Amycolatopsis xylanica TaxID=589385 RepID=A0A1H3CKR2_9PSEU|nr:HAMP domain-containing sensor histidine kinase [Amycolatopsis xylanica]SDX54743.1 two-component system, OmpR family, sensor kinase [Amycolatopsis xylanica]
MRQWRASRLGTRLALGLAALSLVVFAVVGVFSTIFIREFLANRLDEQLTKTQQGQVDPLKNSHGSPLQSYGWYSALFEVRDGVAKAKDGTLPPDSKPLAEVAEAATNTEVLRTVYVKEGFYRVRACPVDRANNIVLVSAAPQSELESTVSRLIWIEVGAFAVALGVLVLFGRIVLRRGLKPLGDMAGTAHDIASHDLTGSPELPVRASGSGGGAEVEELRTAFNVMLEHIESSLAARTAANEKLRRFIADASHELRTPLTSIRGYAELFQYAAANEPAERDAHLAKIRAETARMSVLVDDLLLLARLDSVEADAPLRLADTDLVELVTAAADAFRAGHPDRPLTLDLAESARLRADPVRLRQVLDNLLTNAAVHTPPGTPVTVTVGLEDGIVLRISDEGPGIAPENLPRIFDRFYRVDHSRTRGNGGTGLGLAVVNSLVAAHGGSVEVASRPGRTTFTVRLPLGR